MWSGSGLPAGHCEGKVKRKITSQTSFKHQVCVSRWLRMHTHAQSWHNVLCFSSIKVRVQTQKQYRGIWQCSVATFTNEGVSETYLKGTVFLKLKFSSLLCRWTPQVTVSNADKPSGFSQKGKEKRCPCANKQKTHINTIQEEKRQQPLQPDSQEPCSCLLWQIQHVWPLGLVSVILGGFQKFHQNLQRNEQDFNLGGWAIPLNLRAQFLWWID